MEMSVLCKNSTMSDVKLLVVLHTFFESSFISFEKARLVLLIRFLYMRLEKDKCVCDGDVVVIAKILP